MANLYSFLEQTQRRPRQSLTPSSDPQTQGAQVRQSMSEPTFSPTGLLGDGYDLLRQEMEERSRAATQRPRESPFNGGLLGALDEYENQQMDTTRGQRTSSDTWGVGAGLSRTPSRRSYHGFHSAASAGYVIHGTTKTTLMAWDEWSWRASLYWPAFIDPGGELEKFMGHFYVAEQKPFDGRSFFGYGEI
ncbi:hypothetical protein FAUST_10286 [Fusarium austroamericanum]|uniref:Uncharacterized protein n=1 Tax=Fusarium austroamericanum TaxID=282268 RepID=A0AAN5Z130_FUSAU|nr:hypothetical protein FAUST_10286 [Fusarium austroamericanum]